MNRDMGLSALAPGESATVSGLMASGGIRRRLQDLGLIPGARVECVGISPLGDPAAYLIRGTVIALRRADAAGVRVVGCAPEAAPAQSGVPASVRRAAG